MTWAFKRKFFYVSILLIFFGGFGFLISYPYFNKPPTCFDGKQNGDESGVDCGGSCVLACSFEVDNLSVVWSRAFPVVPGRYNAVAYVENQNVNTVIEKIKYRFRFADANNIYIGKREGETYVPPAGKFAIFEPALDLGSSVPVYTTFEFIENPVWIKVPENIVDQLQFSLDDIVLEESDTPHLSLKLKNNSLFIIPEVDVVTILYDELGNALNASRTYVELLGPEESVDLNFTWPLPFDDKVITKEIIPIFNIFKIK